MKRKFMLVNYYTHAIVILLNVYRAKWKQKTNCTNTLSQTDGNKICVQTMEIQSNRMVVQQTHPLNVIRIIL